MDDRRLMQMLEDFIREKGTEIAQQEIEKQKPVVCEEEEDDYGLREEEYGRRTGFIGIRYDFELFDKFCKIRERIDQIFDIKPTPRAPDILKMIIEHFYDEFMFFDDLMEMRIKEIYESRKGSSIGLKKRKADDSAHQTSL